MMLFQEDYVVAVLTTVSARGVAEQMWGSNPSGLLLD